MDDSRRTVDVLTRVVHRVLLCLLLVVCLNVARQEAPRSLRIYQAAGSSTFNVLRWEADHLVPRLPSLWEVLSAPPRAVPDDVGLLHQYLTLSPAERVQERE